MGYFDEKMGQPPSSLSPEFLEIEAEAGPWLALSQQGAGIDLSKYPRYELDLDQGVIWFGDGQRNGAVAAVQLVGTFTAADKVWLWAWANPKSREPLIQALTKLKEDLPEVPELTEPSCACSEAKAWALAASAAYKMGSQTCFRLPDDVTVFVALYEINEIAAGDPRAARPVQDPELAMRALEEYAGPAVMQIGALLASAVEQPAPALDGVIAALHEMAENLDNLERSPVGQGTRAADEALRLAVVLRQATTLISVPTGSPALAEGIQEVFSLLREVAQQYSAWPTEGEDA